MKHILNQPCKYCIAPPPTQTSQTQILKGTYHAKCTFLALKCILVYIWSVYKYRKD